MLGSNSMGEATQKAIEAPANLALTPLTAMLDIMSLKNPIAGIQQNVRTSIGDLALWGPRMGAHFLIGGAKTLLSLGWSALINARIIPTGTEIKNVFSGTQGKLENLKTTLTGGSEPTLGANPV